MIRTDLNPSQEAAVNHRDGPSIVLAGPGTGKTKVLTSRAAALIQSGIKPEKVLLLTFTKNAAKEMMSRAKRIEPACEYLSGGTFHSIATKTVNANSHVFGLEIGRSFTMLDDEDCKQVVKKLMEPIKNGAENWPRASTVHKVISFSANTRMPIEQCAEQIAHEYADLAPKFREVRDLYVDYKLERGLIDFDDALEYFLALLEDPSTGSMIRRQWSHVMIDEYQDTNQLQLDIIYALAGNEHNVMIVGDPSQSIYSFRGSAPATMARFRERFPESTIIKLDTNYRSSQEIVNVVNAIDKTIKSGFERTLASSQSMPGATPVIRECADDAAQAENIAKSILDHKAHGGEISDVAILVRSMSYARRIEIELTTRRIPYRVVGGLRIDEAAHVKDMLSLARIATNNTHEPAWMRLLQRHNRIGDVASAAISARMTALGNPQDAPDVLERIAPEYKTDFAGLPNALRALHTPDGEPAEVLTAAVAAMEPFWSTQVKEWKDDWEDRRRDIDAILLLATEHLTLESFLTSITLDYSVDQKKSFDAEKQEEMPVTISTVHGAKGLEWPIVHIPSFIQGHIPSNYADDLNEEARILYVAASRPRDMLILHQPRLDGAGRLTQASIFDPIIRPRCTVERMPRTMMHPMHQEQSGIPQRIDMRARLMRP